MARVPDPPAKQITRLALEDGSLFVGMAFGDRRPRTVEGEVCFNTAHSGYQEILTDPSYAGQIVTMTYPLIGNYGVNEQDMESARVHVSGFIVREAANSPSNYRASTDLSSWLSQRQVPGLTAVDTRSLTRKLRVQGALNGVLSTDPDIDAAQLLEQARQTPGLTGRNLVRQVSITKPLHWNGDLGDWEPIQGPADGQEHRYRVVALDCGAKLNIFRHLTDQGCSVTVLPFDASVATILGHQPQGLFVSNGPGDPAAVTETIETLRALPHDLPIFGICLGHQLLSLALGAKTYKLKFGHRGANHPIQNLHTHKVEITSQNHGFAVDTTSLEAIGAEPTHLNLNDQTLAGFRHATRPMFAVQYHPEASPGPHDARYLFDCFMQMIASGCSPTGPQMDQAQRRRNMVQSTEK